MTAQRGFTLLELVMVMVLLGIISAIAVPRYNAALSKYRVDLAARRIAADLTMTQHRARVAAASRSADFHVATSTYQLKAIGDFSNPASHYTVDLSKPPYGVALHSVDLGGDAYITFDGFGMPDSGGTIVVRNGPAQRSIIIDPATGKAIVQ